MSETYKGTCICGYVLIEGFSADKTKEILGNKNYCAYCRTKEPEVTIELMNAEQEIIDSLYAK